MRTLVIVNPNACGGKTVAVYRSIEGRLAELLGDLTVAISEKLEDVGRHIDAAAAAGLDLVIAVGGDGTNHSLVNALARRPGLAAVLGSLPVGTGTDWSRGLEISGDPKAAVNWLAQARPVPCDLGKIEYLDMRNRGRPAERFFLNIASAGVSGEIVARVNRLRRRTSMTFLRTTVAALFKYRPQRITVECDGREFYKGPSYLLAVANGRFFGRGMWVAPKALIDDGLFDVVLVEGMPRYRILLALRTVFSGRHLRRKDVHSGTAVSVRVHSEDGPLGLEFDGEEALGQDLRYSILPGALRVLVHPSSAKVLRSPSFAGVRDSFGRKD
jgi:YegS/Rv2252/BmrU family lipid kinase